MLKYIKIPLLAIIFFSFVACSNKSMQHDPKYTLKNHSDTKIISFKQGKEINLDELINEVEHYPVIFVGDHHNTNETHEFFNNFLEKLALKGYNLHMANEWFTPEHNTLLKDYTDDKIDEFDLKEMRKWDQFTKHRWEIVEPLYETIKKSNGRLYGANISKKDRKKISNKHLDKMDENLKTFYNNLDLNISSHKSLIEPFFKDCHKFKRAKSKSNEPCQNRMYRVQVTWDTYMANESAKIADQVLQTKKDKLIVFAGAMHVEYGLGIPLRFARLNNTPYYILSNHKYDLEEDNITIDPLKADSVFVYGKLKKK